MTEELNFDDIAPIEIPVVIKGKRYTLKEASGDAACRYRNAVLSALQVSKTGEVTGARNLADTEPLLVSLCLFDEQDKPVPIKTVRSWPARVVRTLFEKAADISDLADFTRAKIEEQKENPTGNEPDYITDGSG